MRQDMHRKLIERGRWGSSWLKNERVKAERQALQRARATGDYEGLCARTPMRPRRRLRKSPSETFGPLVAFLRTQVGRPWDNVYSEIRQNIDPSSVIDMHIMQHLFDFVRREVWIDDQKHVWRRCWQGPAELFDNGRTFYVHPRTGMLCRPTHTRPRRSAVARVPHLTLEDGGLGLRIDKMWFRVDTRRLDGDHHPVYTDAPVDVVLQAAPSWHNAARREALYGSVFLIGVHKRQLSRKAVRGAAHQGGGCRRGAAKKPGSHAADLRKTFLNTVP